MSNNEDAEKILAEQAAKAARLRNLISELKTKHSPPRTPRDFTESEASKTAQKERSDTPQEPPNPSANDGDDF